MGAPTIKKFSLKERPTADDLNTIYSTFAAKFGALNGDDFFYPLIFGGDLDLAGNRLLRVRELFGILNMEEYGTDAEAFEGAISSLDAGGVILIPRNTTIQLSKSIRVSGTRSRIYIIGSGHSSQIQMQANSDDDAIVIEGSRRFRLANFYINGNRANNSSGRGIYLSESEDFEISNVWIGDGTTTGVCGNGIEAKRCSDFIIKKNWIRNNKQHGIYIGEECSNWSVSQNFIDQDGNPNSGASAVGGFGIKVTARAANGTISDNTIKNMRWDGMSIDNGSQHITIHNNTVNGFGNDTVTQPGWTEFCGIITGSNSEQNPCMGITISGNVCTGGQIGIGVSAHVHGCLVTGNYVRGNSVRPLGYWGSDKTTVTFRGNMCMNMSNNGRFSFGTGLSITALNIGVSNLPIQAIHATWDVYPSGVLKNCVLGARYTGTTVYFYNSSAITGTRNFWYTIEV